MESLYTIAIFLVLLGILGIPYWIRVAKHRREAAHRLEKNIRAGIGTPVTLHPHIDLLRCIGCGNCVRACPEDALGIVNGRAAVVNGMRCVGHGLCADVCPVGAISLGFGTPKQGMEIPYYDDNYETNVENLYIIGELGGIGLIKNAVSQGIKAVYAVMKKQSAPCVHEFEVIIVGAGPAGLSAALAAQANGLRYVVLEQDSIGGSVLHYPRHKLVLTSPVELPLYGKLKASEISKEELLAIWHGIVRGFNLNILTNQKVESIERQGDGFVVRAGGRQWTGSHVVLALGRRGSPRKLGVPGEDLPKVTYTLIEAETYQHKHVLVVGGGDSAVEATIALASQAGNTVTLSYRREAFLRLKEKNEQRIMEWMNANKITVLFNSNVVEIIPDSVIVREHEHTLHTLRNDFVFIFAGGELPTDLLKKMGVRLRTREVDVIAV